jgi:hypothetical protein
LSSPCTPSLVLCITCLVPALYPLLSCIPCLGSAPQYILCAYSVHSFPVCITSTSILASLRCTCFVIAWQILSTLLSTFRANPNRPRRTLRPTDRNSEPTVTANLTPCLHCHHPYLSHLDPHHPDVWDKLSSIMSKPRRWSLDLPLPLTRTVKIPLQFRGKENHPPNISQDLGELNPSSPPKESRFWTYLLEDVKTEDVGDPSQYATLDQVLTRAQLRQMRERGEIPSLHHLKGMNSTGVSITYPATSSTTSDKKSQPALSNPT